MIDHEWYETWLRLPYGHSLYWSFLEYAAARLESFSKGMLAVPDCDEDASPYEYKTSTISIDGMKLGSSARTGMLVRLGANLSFRSDPQLLFETSQHRAKAAE